MIVLSFNARALGGVLKHTKVRELVKDQRGDFFLKFKKLKRR